MNTLEAVETIGGFSKPTKMPCHSWSIPAQNCKTGMKLRKIAGSVCSKCYAMKGNYPFPNVQAALKRRLNSLENKAWKQAMTIAISGVESSGYFRWFDSGDLQSLQMLEDIADIAKALPNVRFWLPTREYAIVGEYVRKNGAFPSNLVVRLSSYMIEGKPPIELANRLGVATSGVSKDEFNCPASTQGNKCLTCRLCWDKNIKTVFYKKH